MFGKKENGTAGTQNSGKKPWLKWVVIAAVVGVGGFVIYNTANAAKSKLPTVDVVSAERGDLEEIVSISGTVNSALTKEYYADYSARIAGMSLKDGDRVNKGDTLISYDSEDLEYQKKQAELNLQQAQGSYEDSLQREGRAVSKKSAADRSLP